MRLATNVEDRLPARLVEALRDCLDAQRCGRIYHFKQRSMKALEQRGLVISRHYSGATNSRIFYLTRRGFEALEEPEITLAQLWRETSKFVEALVPYDTGKTEFDRISAKVFERIRFLADDNKGFVDDN